MSSSARVSTYGKVWVVYISKVELENIRGVGPEKLVIDLAKPAKGPRGRMSGWNVLVGPNGFGKTTVLQAIAASLVGPTGGAWLLRADEIPHWIRHGEASASCKTWVERDFDDDGLSSGHTAIRPIPLLVTWTRGGETKTVRPRGFGELLKYFWNASTGVEPNGWIFIGYGPRRSVTRSSHDAASLLNAPPRTASVVTLFRDDAALEKGYEWLTSLTIASRRDDAAKGMVLAAVFRLLSDGLLFPGQKSYFLIDEEGLKIQFEPDDIPISTRLLGDGFRMLIEMVLDILFQIDRFKPGRLLEECLRWPSDFHFTPTIEMSGVVVIDEPENHLHPSMQQHVGFWLKKHFPRIQFIVATHSALICQAADRDGLMRMRQPFEVETVDENTWEAVTNGTINDAIATRLFGLPNPYAPEGQKLRNELNALESKMQRQRATEEELRRRDEILSKLPDSTNLKVATLLEKLAAGRR
jgi:energy-coupling factor transporter ATP-binding protein EcfA2